MDGGHAAERTCRLSAPAALSPPRLRQGSMTNTAVRAMEQLLRGANPQTVTHADLHRRHVELIAAHATLRSAVPRALPPHGTCPRCVDLRGMICPVVRERIAKLPAAAERRPETGEFAIALDELVADVDRAHHDGPAALRKLVTEWADRLKPQHKTRKRDTGQMVLTTCTDGERQLKRMRAQQIANAEAASAAHRKAAADLFEAGTGDTKHTVAEADCCKELLWSVQAQKRALITIHLWSPTLMGKAARTLFDVLGVPINYLGDCSNVNPSTLGRSRTSADLARRLLAARFPGRMQCGEYRQKSDAREALAQELGGTELVCFVDATQLPLLKHDWDEAAKVAEQCGVIFVVSIAARGDSPSWPPLMQLGETTDSTRGAATAPAAADGGRINVLGQYREVVMGIIEDWSRRRDRDLNRMEQRMNELEGYGRRLMAHEHGMVREALALLVREGAVVEGSDEEEL